MITPTIRASWRKDPTGYYKVFISGKERPEGTQAQVEAYSGNITHVTLTGTHSQCGKGFLYWYKEIAKTKSETEPVTGPIVTQPSITAKKEVPDISIDDLDEALGF